MPKRSYSIETTLLSLKQINNSVWGNPRYELSTSDGVFLTQSDASVASGIENDHPVGKRVRLTLTPAGRVFGMEVLGFDHERTLP